MPVVFVDATDGDGGPLWADDAMPPNGSVIEPGDAVAIELTLGHTVRIQLAEPDEYFMGESFCDANTPVSIQMEPF